MQIHISRAGEKFGPYTLEQVNQYLVAGNLKPTDTAWYEGAPGWMPITQVPGVTAPAFAAAHSRMEVMALGAVGVGALALVTGGVTYWAGMVLMIITIVLGVAGLALGIIGLVRIKNGMGDRRGSGLAIAGAALSPLAVVLALVLNPDGAAKTGSKYDANKAGDSDSERKPRKASRSDRIKCVSNIKQVGGALNSFADDNKNRYPWLLTWRDQVAEQGGMASARCFYETSTMFAQAGVKSGFGGSQKILVSPCDPERKAANDQVDLSLAHHATNPIPNNAHSYGVVTGGGFTEDPPQPFSMSPDKGADMLKPSTVLTVTRNISAERLSDAPSGNPSSGRISHTSTWLGADHEPDNPRVMKRFFEGMGSLGRADGSGVQSDDDQLRRVAQDHIRALGGNYKGIASSVLDTPND